MERCKLNDKDTFLLLEPTSPYRLHKDFNDLVDLYFKNNFKKIVSVQEAISSNYRFQFFKEKNSTLKAINNSDSINGLRRQDIKKTYFLDGSFYMSSVGAFKNNPGFIDKSTGCFESNFFSSFEIDCLNDLQLLESIFFQILIHF